MKWLENIFYYFQGRYGRFDEFSKALAFLGLVAFALYYLTGFRLLIYLGGGLVAYGVLRPTSKRINAREKELFAYQNFKEKVTSAFNGTKHFFSRVKPKKARNPESQVKEAQTSQSTPQETRIIHCPNCQQKLRVPRGKTLVITCQQCDHRFKQST